LDDGLPWIEARETRDRNEGPRNTLNRRKIESKIQRAKPSFRESLHLRIAFWRWRVARIRVRGNGRRRSKSVTRFCHVWRFLMAPVALAQSIPPIIRSSAIMFDRENDQFRFRHLVDDCIGKFCNPALVKVGFELPKSVRSFADFQNS
jgi:hypothetical protein